MTFNRVGLLLTAAIGVAQALRISDHVANYTATRAIVNKEATIFADGSPPPLPPRPALPPPLPPRPVPQPPKEPYLALFDDASDDVWEKAKCKGANFVRAMRGSDRDAGQVFKPPRDSAASEFENLDFGMISEHIASSTH